MSKRKTILDAAIEHVDQKIADHVAEIKALQFARQHLVDQQLAHQGRRDAADLAAARPPQLKTVSK